MKREKQIPRETLGRLKENTNFLAVGLKYPKIDVKPYKLAVSTELRRI